MKSLFTFFSYKIGFDSNPSFNFSKNLKKYTEINEEIANEK